LRGLPAHRKTKEDLNEQFRFLPNNRRLGDYHFLLDRGRPAGGDMQPLESLAVYVAWSLAGADPLILRKLWHSAQAISRQTRSDVKPSAAQAINLKD
jgi:hypothetical protein